MSLLVSIIVPTALRQLHDDTSVDSLGTHCQQCHGNGQALWRVDAYVQVVEGMDVVKTIEGTRTGRMDKPEKPIVVADAGELD